LLEPCNFASIECLISTLFLLNFVKMTPSLCSSSTLNEEFFFDLNHPPIVLVIVPSFLC